MPIVNSERSPGILRTCLDQIYMLYFKPILYFKPTTDIPNKYNIVVLR